MSERLPALKPREVLRALEHAGFAVHPISGSHYILKHSFKSHLRVTLSWHNKDLIHHRASGLDGDRVYRVALKLAKPV